jgi:hypothetical protein
MHIIYSSIFIFWLLNSFDPSIFTTILQGQMVEKLRKQI